MYTPIRLPHPQRSHAQIIELSAREAKTMRDEVAAKLYRRLLKEEVTSRRIDEAEDPATVLKSLCEQVRLSFGAT